MTMPNPIRINLLKSYTMYFRSLESSRLLLGHSDFVEHILGKTRSGMFFLGNPISTNTWCDEMLGGWEENSCNGTLIEWPSISHSQFKHVGP